MRQQRWAAGGAAPGPHQCHVGAREEVKVEAKVEAEAEAEEV
jgi:hypothetical protein